MDYEQLNLNQTHEKYGNQKLPESGVYLITGGLGRIGMTLTEFLAKKSGKLVLITKSDFPAQESWTTIINDPEISEQNREILAKLLHYQSLGATILVLQADMSQYDQVRNVFQIVLKQFGEIQGIFHAAGVANLKYLPDLTEEVVQQEFAAKITGTINLDRVLQELTLPKSLEFVVLFSSMASILGGYGMAAYAAANCFLDAFVQEKLDSGQTPWISINWDDWDFEYGKEQISIYSQTASQYAMSAEEGIQSLLRIIGANISGQILVSTRPLQTRIEQWVDQKNSKDLPVEILQNEVDTHAPNDKMTELEAQIMNIYKEVLGAANISLDENLFDLGGDSLQASQILLKLRQIVSKSSEIQLHDIFDYPTVQQLSDYLKKEHPLN